MSKIKFYPKTENMEKRSVWKVKSSILVVFILFANFAYSQNYDQVKNPMVSVEINSEWQIVENFGTKSNVGVIRAISGDNIFMLYVSKLKNEMTELQKQLKEGIYEESGKLYKIRSMFSPFQNDGIEPESAILHQLENDAVGGKYLLYHQRGYYISVFFCCPNDSVDGNESMKHTLGTIMVDDIPLYMPLYGHGSKNKKIEIIKMMNKKDYQTSKNGKCIYDDENLSFEFDPVCLAHKIETKEGKGIQIRKGEDMATIMTLGEKFNPENEINNIKLVIGYNPNDQMIHNPKAKFNEMPAQTIIRYYKNEDNEVERTRIIMIETGGKYYKITDKGINNTPEVLVKTLETIKFK